MKTIRRNKMRGKPLDRDCYKAYTTTNEFGPEDHRIYCYGLYDPMNDEPIEKCRQCNAFVRNVKPPKER